MSTILNQVLTANQKYSASFGDKANLALPPARRFAVLTCMDARLDPAKFAGLSEGDAHVIRNAGGRASDDAIRSLIMRRQSSPPLVFVMSAKVQGRVRVSSLSGSPFRNRNRLSSTTYSAYEPIRWSHPQSPSMATFMT
jgi:hypothetical protein